MLLSHHDHVVQTLASDGAHQSFRKRILPTALRCCRDLGDPHVPEAIPETLTVDLVPVSDRVPWRRVFGKRFQDLQGRPGGRRMLRDVEMNDPPAVVEKDDEDEWNSTGDARYSEEVDRA